MRRAFSPPLFSIALAALVAAALCADTLSAAPASPKPSAARTGASASASTFVLQGAVRVTCPSPKWRFDADPRDTRGVSLRDDGSGLQIVLRWVDNPKRLDSLRLAAVLESKLMRADNAKGRRFTMPRRTVVGGVPASRFSEEHIVSDVLLHCTEYTVAARDAHCLVVAVSGGTDWLTKRRTDIDAVLASVRFL